MMTSNYWFGGAQAYQIDNSLRFRASAGNNLQRTQVTATDANKTSWSAWVKMGVGTPPSPGGYGGALRGGGNPYHQVLYVYSYASAASTFGWSMNWGSNAAGKATTNFDTGSNTGQHLRDFSGWYHLYVRMGSATGNGAMRMYVNGQEIFYQKNDNVGAEIWRWQYGVENYGSYGGASQYWDGYLAEVHMVDGQELDPTEFGEFNNEGVWVPKKYTGTYGNNGYYLKFDPAATNGIGHDHSGNGNNFTPFGFVTSGTGTDVMSDTPTNNFATLNPIYLPTNMTFADGNLYFQPTVSSWAVGRSNFGVSSGKWYCEMKLSSINQCRFALTARQDNDVRNTNAICYNHSGSIEKAGSVVVNASGWGSGNVMGMAFDASAGSCAFYRDGVLQGTVTGLDTTLTWFPAVDAYTGSTYGYFNFGQRAFEQTKPTGYESWCTANLPEPTIKDGGKYFNTVLYSGSSNNTQNITGVGFQPDMTWIKARNSTDSHTLSDAVRGAGIALRTNSTAAEANNSSSFTSFNSDGFTVAGASGDTNQTGVNYVAWNWDAGGAGSSNNAGTITSTVSANASAGFSIATYTGNGTAGATIGHGLGVAPKMIFVKSRNNGGASYYWAVYHESIGAGNALELNSTTGSFSASTLWNSTTPTSSVFSVGSNVVVNGSSGQTYVAYCFSEVAGYSKFGSYTGNGSSDGPFVFCGLRPAWVLIKRTGGADDWFMYDTTRDTYNEAYRAIDANTSDIEKTSNTIPIDILSNGFKIRSSGTAMNGNGETIIFAAFAELPFKYANAR